jgi:lipoprotein-releasing system ATP-binding protein
MTSPAEMQVATVSTPKHGARKEPPRTSLIVAHLAKSFPSPAGATIPVLADVSFTTFAGDTLAIMGASGAGKTTLLNVIGGLEVQDSGTVSFETDGLRGDEIKISFIFQFHYLLPDLSVLENVSMPLLIERQPAKQARRRAILTLEGVGLGDLLDHKIGFLSGGEQQRVAVARSLVNEPKVILADEPTGNLDESIAGEIGSLLTNYARQKGAIVLIATHNDHLAASCDRVLMIQDGQVAERDQPGHS